VTVVVDSKATLLGGGWFAAKLMCEVGCQSFVAIFVVKGRERRELMVGTMARPLGTASDPDCGVLVRGEEAKKKH
jgi:hypothetical protein